MAREAQLILETLDRHLRGPGTIRLLGGAALTLLSTHTTAAEVEARLLSVVVPEVFSESWPRARAALTRLLTRTR